MHVGYFKLLYIPPSGVFYTQNFCWMLISLRVEQDTFFISESYLLDVFTLNRSVDLNCWIFLISLSFVFLNTVESVVATSCILKGEHAKLFNSNELMIYKYIFLSGDCLRIMYPLSTASLLSLLTEDLRKSSDSA